MKTKSHLALPAVLALLAALPATAKPGPDSVADCGVTEIVLSTADGLADINATFRNECAGVDMAGTAQLFIDGAPASDPVALDSSDHVLVSVKLPLADAAESHEVCLRVEGTASRKRGKNVVTEALSLEDCQALQY